MSFSFVVIYGQESINFMSKTSLCAWSLVQASRFVEVHVSLVDGLCAFFSLLKGSGV